MLLKTVRHLPFAPRAFCCSSLVVLPSKRALVTLAIESSCDDTSVAVLEKHEHNQALEVHFHEKITSNNLVYRGIHPLVAQDSHEQNLAHLVSAAIAKLPASTTHGVAKNGEQPSALKEPQSNKPDFVTVTRGPGMRSSLNVGLNTAKGLAVAWRVPLVGVNHMQAHALTPRLVSAMSPRPASNDTASQHGREPLQPSFPFLSLLVSGGHTMLIRSTSLCTHPTLAATADIAIGDAIDKAARSILPADVLASSATTMYGPLLEAFAFEGGARAYAYEAPATRGREMQTRVSAWGWGFKPTFAESRAGAKARSMEYSFSSLASRVQSVMEEAEAAREVTVEERREMAREAMRIAFEHLASRVVLGLEGLGQGPGDGDGIDTLVVSGGVAANGYLRHILRHFLDARGYENIRVVFPPLELCTDNAVMIGWTGIEMFEAGWASELSCQSLRKWSLDPEAEDGGIFGVAGWKRLSAS